MTSDGGKKFRKALDDSVHQLSSHTGVSQLSTSSHDAPSPAQWSASFLLFIINSSSQGGMNQSNSEETYRQNFQGAIKKMWNIEL